MSDGRLFHKRIIADGKKENPYTFKLYEQCIVFALVISCVWNQVLISDYYCSAGVATRPFQTLYCTA